MRSTAYLSARDAARIEEGVPVLRAKRLQSLLTWREVRDKKHGGGGESYFPAEASRSPPCVPTLPDEGRGWLPGRQLLPR
jgi:hypothetical protein